MKNLRWLSAFLFLGSVSMSPAAVFTVINTADAGAGSLRQAIIDANALPGLDTIDFNIPGDGPHTIAPLIFALPAITSPVVIDGYTQGDGTSTVTDDALQNTNATGGLNTVLKIVLNGVNAGGTSGLVILAGDSTVRGLAINRFGEQGINLTTSGGNTIEGNFVGTNVTGTAVAENGFSGIFMTSGDNVIGGTTPAARNLSSGNFFHGVEISGSDAIGNLVQGNLIGTNAAGTASLSGTTSFGIFITEGASDNIIGGTTPGARNVVAGNILTGILIRDSSGTRIEGNYLGTDVTGTAALGNNDGVALENSTNNTIGGTAPGAGNLLSGNRDDGASIFGSGSTGNLVQGNLVGTDVSGTAALPNGDNGLTLSGAATGNTIGGTTPEARNIISGAVDNGVDISGGSSGNIVRGNFIGTDVTGTAALGNGGDGVLIEDSPDNTIGGRSADGNVISGNDDDGIFISGAAATGQPDPGQPDRDHRRTGAAHSAMAAMASISAVPTRPPITLSAESAAARPNTIAFNGARGIFVSGGTGNARFPIPSFPTAAWGSISATPESRLTTMATATPGRTICKTFLS